MACRQRGELFGVAGNEPIGTDDEPAGSLLDKLTSGERLVALIALLVACAMNLMLVCSWL